MTTTTYPENLFYTPEGLWVEIDGNIATVGFTDVFTDGETIEFLDLPHLGGVREGDDLGSVETMKISSSYQSPVSGEIIEINPEAEMDADLITDLSYEDGWVFKVEMSEREVAINTLLTAAAFNKLQTE